MAYYSKYTGAELEEKLDKVEEIPQLIAQMITGKDFVTKEDLLCVLRDYAPATYATIPIDNNTIYWENGVLKAATSDGTGQCQWELREHNGIQYLYSRLPVVTQYDVTMYADVNHLDLPSIYDGLPIDGDTIYWEETENGRILKSKYEGSSGVDASEVLSIVSGAGYATQNWVNNQSFITQSYLATELLKYVTLDNYQEIIGVKNFINGLQISNIPIKKLEGYDDILYIDSNVVIRGGLTMYYEDGEINLPSIKEEIGNAGYDGVTGLASFDSSQFYISSDGTVTIIGGSAGLDTAQLKDYLDSNKYTTETWVKEQGYASASSLSSLQIKVNNFLEGSDTDTIINKWKELEAFLSGLSESDNLATILSTKWTTDNDLINQWNTAYGWGDHSKVGYALKSYVDGELAKYVTLGTKQTITGEKNFTGGLKVNGSPIYYDETNKYWKLEGDLLVTGGVSMYSDDTSYIPSTIMDAVVVDGVTIKKRSEDGALYFAGTMDGGVTDFWELNNIPTWIGSSKPTYTLGSLQNVDSSSIDATATVDRVLFQSAGSATWVTKPLSEIGGGGGSVSGAVRYLSTLGSAGSWYDNTYRLYGEWGLHDRLHLKTEGGYDVVANLAEKDGNGNVIASTYLPLSGGTITGGFGALSIKVNNNYGQCIKFENNSSTMGYLGFNSNNKAIIYEGSDISGSSYDIIHAGNYSSYALPLSGGTLTNTLIVKYGVGLWIQKASTQTASSSIPYIRFGKYTADDTADNTTVNGELGVNDSKELVFYKGTASGSWLKVLHEGNYSDYALPLSGGTITGAGNKLITLVSNSHNYVDICYSSKGSTVNWQVGADSGDTFYFFNNYISKDVIKIDKNGVIKVIGASDDNRFLCVHYSGIDLQGSTGGYAMGISTYNNDGTSNGHLAAVYGTGGAFQYWYFGGTYKSHALKITADKTVTMQEIEIGHTNEVNALGSALYLNYRGSAIAILGNNGKSAVVASDWSSLSDAARNRMQLCPLSVRGPIFSYSFNLKQNSASFVFDKNGNHFTGIGTNGETDTIYFGAVDGNNMLDWVSYSQIWKFGGSIITTGGITMYSDIRKKTKLQDVELSLSQIANAPLIEHYYNSDQNKTTHVGSIAQYWASMNDWFCKLDSEGYYTMEIQNCALASAISIARHLEKYESKTDKKIRQLKKRISQLEDELELLKKGV